MKAEEEIHIISAQVAQVVDAFNTAGAWRPPLTETL